MQLRVLFSAAVFLLALIMAAPCLAARSTRDLVFDDDEVAAPAAKSSGAASVSSVAVRASVELARDGKTSMVLPTHIFHSGDKVKLRYVLNADGYVYWLAKMSSGSYAMLFPSNKTGMDNYVKKNQEQTVPVKGSFRFDNTSGTESLLLVYSTTRISELDQAVAEANGNEERQVSSQASGVAKIESDNAQKRRSRDLVFEDEDEDEVNTKTQKGEQGQPMVVLFQLIHK